MNKPNDAAINAQQSRKIHPMNSEILAVKAQIIDIIHRMNALARSGYNVQFNIITNPSTGESKLDSFRVMHEVKLEV